MKKMWILALPVLMFLGIRAVADNSLTAPYDFSISQTVGISQTQQVITWSDSNDVAPDSLIVIYLSGSDTLYKELVEPVTQTSDTLNGLSPFTLYRWALKVSRNDSNAVSNWDSLYTLPPKLEAENLPRPRQDIMRGARDDGTAHYDTLYIDGKNGLDSTKVFTVSAYMWAQIKMINDADANVDTKFLIYDGTYNPYDANDVANLGTGANHEYYDESKYLWAFNFAATDSITCTLRGWTKPIKLNVNEPHFYIRAEGQSGCSAAEVTKAVIRLYRKEE